jgi:hypothetical protein
VLTKDLFKSVFSYFDRAVGRAHTGGMDVCDLIAVAPTAAHLATSRSLRQIHQSTSPRPA